METETAANRPRSARGARTLKDRAQILLRYHALITQYADELADLIVKEHGKTKAEALGDAAKGNGTVEYACSLPQLAAGRIMGVSRGVVCRDLRVSLGVTISIVPLALSEVQCPICYGQR
ncbi:hypothetical protein H9P43_006738 [Blastocladiella emersonii ATCC 22665]|nr:hypothetical protein H9P43_006738 [Blastocladiella emersonii ATCC 22665]